MNYTLAMARGDSQRAMTGYRQRKLQTRKYIAHMVTQWSVLAVVGLSVILLPFHIHMA